MRTTTILIVVVLIISQFEIDIKISIVIYGWYLIFSNDGVVINRCL